MLTSHFDGRLEKYLHVAVKDCFFTSSNKANKLNHVLNSPSSPDLVKTISRNCLLLGVTSSMLCFLLRVISIYMAALSLTYNGTTLQHQCKFTMDKPMTANIWLSHFRYDLNEFPAAGHQPFFSKINDKYFKPANLLRKFLVQNDNYVIVWWHERPFEFQEMKTPIEFVFLLSGRKLFILKYTFPLKIQDTNDKLQAKSTKTGGWDLCSTRSIFT